MSKEMADDATSQLTVRRVDAASIVEVRGEVTAASEDALSDAHQRAGDVSAVVLDFSKLSYMNSSGIGLLVTLLVRANRRSQRILACGLTEHYRRIFELTRLDEAIGIYDTEEDALNAARTG
jgi:anti-sigma B factor antagonist